MYKTPRATIHSRVAILGHPIHPMMIHFPVAMLLALVASDLAYLYTEDPFWTRTGLWLAGVGAFGGWGASIAGLIDLCTVKAIRSLVTGWCHAVLAVMMLSVASLNWLVRFHDASAILPWGLGLSLLTAVMLVLASVFGAQLIYEHTVGVNVEEIDDEEVNERK